MRNDKTFVIIGAFHIGAVEVEFPFSVDSVERSHSTLSQLTLDQLSVRKVN